jgi:hypothetical protein
MSMTLTRKGAPSITSPHPRQRIATLSRWMVEIRIPLMSNGIPGS